ncbi:ZIP family metal transporter [Candidatus Gracilibacteria bacterium]|nr:ZIP family metal transporter [Candidatus Gracilibacteria bacterium]
MFLPLLILALISATGLLLYFFKKINTTFLNLLIALGAGSMLAVSLVHIFPESFKQTEMAVYAFLGGFIAIYLVEELLTRHKHDHDHGDHAHEDPHEHYDHVAIVSFIAIFIHTLLDGVGIRAGMGLSETAGYAILFGVGVHQIPVSLSLAALMRESKLERKIQILFVALFALAAPLGYFLSDIVLSNVSEITVGLAAAFAGGSLLYIATTDLLPVIHSTSKNKYLSVSAFLIGVLFMTVFAEHHHEEHGHDDHTLEIEGEGEHHE